MDISGILTVLLAELNGTASLPFENHFYGCITLLEQWAEGDADLSGSLLTFKDGTLFDISGSWASIGTSHGFSDTTLPYEGSSNYKNLWMSIFATKRVELADLDAMEDAVFPEIVHHGAVFFADVWKNVSGDAVEEATAAATTATATAVATAIATVIHSINIIVKPKVRRHRKTRMGRRIITPIRHPRRLCKTRKSKGLRSSST